MNTICQFAAAVMKSIDRLAVQITNHEAVVSAAICDVEANSEKARSRLEQFEQESLALRQYLQELREKEERCLQEIRAVASSDRAQALEILRHCKQIQLLIAELEQEERVCKSTLKLFQGDLSNLEQQLHKLKLRRMNLSARVLAAPKSLEKSKLVAIDTYLKRWETSVDKNLSTAATSEQTNSISNSTEEDVSLRALEMELDSLLAKEII